MRLTTQEEYGLRCLLQVARGQEESLTTPQIAEREGLTQAHVHKLMRVLRRAGLVKSVRGRKGGYQLARPAEQINVGVVLASLGGNLYSTDFCGQHAGNERICVRNNGAPVLNADGPHKYKNPTADAAGFACDLPKLLPVTLAARS